MMFIEDASDFVFEVLNYKPIEGGVKPTAQGRRTMFSVDLALLEVDTEHFFPSIQIDMTKELQRLKWVTDRKDVISGNVTIFNHF